MRQICDPHGDRFPQGVGAIGVIRLSGSDAVKIAGKVFSGKNLEETESHTVHYGHVMDNEKEIDEVLVSIFRAQKVLQPKM